MSNRLPIIGVIVAVVLFLIYSSVFVVNEREQAIVLRFGEIVDVKTEPGIYFKAPFAFFDADNVQIIEDRLLRFDLDNIRVQVSGGKFYEVDAFVAYKHLRSAACSARRCRASVELAEQRLRTRLDAALRRVYGLRGFECGAVGRARRDDARGARPAAAGRRLARPRDRGRAHPPHRPDGGGLAADLRPHEGRASGRSRAAARARPRGGAAHPRQAPTARWSRSSPRRSKESEILRGEGEAERNAIFADAFQRDPEFFEFYRSMNAYVDGARRATARRWCCRPNSEFFRFFRNAEGTAPPPTPAPPASAGAAAGGAAPADATAQ